nr:ABC transporter permease subunit [uncultured Lichenicoccus sp.]
MSRALRMLAAPVVLLALWSLAALLATGPSGLVPAPWVVLAQIVRDGWAFYGPNIWPTIGEAARGFLWGNGLAIGVALLVLLLPALQRVVLQLAAVSYCIPVIAVGPLLTLVFSGRTPMVALSALSVFFTTLVGLLVGVRGTDRTSLEFVRACGGGAWQCFRRVQFASCLPALFAALGIAAPASLLGAILGEWLGSVQSGLGVAMVVSMQQMAASRSWGIALVSGALACFAYALVARIGHWLTPWRQATSP